MLKKMNNDYIFIRHGQTYWNKNGIMHGQYDIPLNYTGIKQAKKISFELKNEHFDLCLCSPLKRAKSTAYSILLHHKNTQIVFDDRLKELDKGLLEGKHLNSEKLLKNEDQRFLQKFKIESKNKFFIRVKEFIEETEKRYKNKKTVPTMKRFSLKKSATTYSPANAVPSALIGLTSEFGMGSGGTLSLRPPEI